MKSEFKPKELHWAVGELATTDKRYIHWRGGRSGMKSFLVSIAALLASYEKGYNVLFLRYTMTSAEKSVIPEFMEKLQLEPFDRIASDFTALKNRVTNNRTGSYIDFMGAKSATNAQTANMKGMGQYKMVVIEEGEEFSDEVYFEKLDDTIRKGQSLVDAGPTDNARFQYLNSLPELQEEEQKELDELLSIYQKTTPVKIVVIENPSNKNHQFYRRWIKNSYKNKVIDGVTVQMSTHPDVLAIHTTYLDLPPGVIDNNLARKIAKAKRERPDFYAHNYIGKDKDTIDGAFFSECNIATFRFIPEDARLSIGVDTGSVDASTIMLCGINDTDLYLEELYYKRNSTEYEIADAIVHHCKRLRIYTVYGDHDHTVKREVEKRGITYRFAYKQRKEEQLRALKGYNIFLKGENTIDEFANVKTDGIKNVPKKTPYTIIRDGKEVILKDDSIDGGQYGFWPLHEAPVINPNKKSHLKKVRKGARF